jgi:hypothetical protein
MSEIPEYLTVEEPNYDQFRTRVHIEVMGTVVTDVPSAQLPGSGKESGTLRSSTNSDLSWAESLGKNIINLEAWLHGHYLETIEAPREMTLNATETFCPDWDTAELGLETRTREVVIGARQRAVEDHTHFLYVLGNWAYLADKNDHVNPLTARRLEQIFEIAKSASVNPPKDATTDEFRGGAE